MENKQREDSGIGIKDLLYILKKKIILLLVIVVAVTAVGVVYGKMQKPKYTATQLVVLRAEDETVDKENTTDNISAMIAYVDTVVAFVKSGVVIDRANYHYNEYLKRTTNGEFKTDEEGKAIDKYITWSDMHREEYYDWRKQFVDEQTGEDKYTGLELGVRYYSAGNVATEQGEKTTNGNSQFNFTVSYTDDYRQDAIEKVKILVHALRLESVELDSNFQRKYFYGVEVEIQDKELKGVSPSVSFSKTVIMFLAIGIVLGLVAVYLSHFLDNTIKTKEELERVSGVGVMSVIEYIGGDK
jgi:capsular polysaccharide biosynthesis protein